MNSCDGYIIEFDYEGAQAFRDIICDIINNGNYSQGSAETDLEQMLNDKDSKYRLYALIENKKLKEFSAVTIYKVYDKVPQLKYIAGRGDYGKQGIRALTEHEIKTEGLCYFAEASGTVEQILVKNNSYKVPNVFAEEILRADGIVPRKDDLFHYERRGSDGKAAVKALYGFKDSNLFDKIAEDIIENAATYVEYDTFEEYRDAANKVTALKENQDESFRSLLEKDNYFVYDILDSATEYFVRLEELHIYDCQINEFPEQIFEHAEFMLYVIDKLGNPAQYEEAEAAYKKWLSEAGELALLTWQG